MDSDKTRDDARVPTPLAAPKRSRGRAAEPSIRDDRPARTPDEDDSPSDFRIPRA